MSTGKRQARGRHEYLVTSGEQRRALASPVRQEVVDTLHAAGPSTMARLAGLLGRPADGLYFHVKVLLRVGLVVEAGTSGSGRSLAAVYDVPGRPLRLAYGSTRAERAEIARIIRAAIRLSQREYERACARGERAEQPGRVLWGGRAKGWLSGVQQRRAGTLLKELESLLQSGSPGRGARLMSFGYLLAPCEGARAGRRTGGRRERSST
ncbi:MAG: ArsR family transcriptional regulator [Leptolyngbya sp. PLA1]|nr:ArsR family transcriptional regulator [Leptolyngbya sp. PLA1]